MSPLTGTEKQVKYAEDLRQRTLSALESAALEIEDFINREIQLGDATPEEIARIIVQKPWGSGVSEIRIGVAFSMGGNPIPLDSIKKYESFPKILRSIASLSEKMDSAKRWIEMAGTGTTTIYLSHWAKHIKLNTK